jgi:hypothetical protein
MRDMKKAQVKEKQLAEKKRLDHMREIDEEWDSQFQSTRHSGGFGSSPKLEYDNEVEQALEKLLGKDQLESVKKEGLLKKPKKEEGEEGQDAGEEEQAEGDEEEDEKDDKKEDDKEEGNEEEKEDGNEEQDEKGDADEDKNDGKDDGKKDGKDDPKKDGEVQVPIEKHPKPWELPDPQKRTEILVGVRYNKDFENLFDDKLVLKERKPVRIVRVKAHYNKEFVVGVQFSYMTETEELVDGLFHGDKKVTLNNLQKIQHEIQYRERITEITACFSKGLHWLELKTNEGRSLMLGDKKGASTKAVIQSKKVKEEEDEKLTYVSGGFTGKDKRFTYLAFHLESGWGKEADHFNHMDDGDMVDA